MDILYFCELNIQNNSMYSSRKSDQDIVFSVFKDKRTVFRLKDIALLVGETNFQSLNKKMNYYVHTGKLFNPRKGIYTKQDYNPEELACIIYTPSYISLEYALQKSGVIFQYDSGITTVSYLSRSIEVNGRSFRFRKIKGEILVNPAGIIRQQDYINIASAERAFLDLLYLNTTYYFDNLNPLNKRTVHNLLSIYQSSALSERVKKILQYG
jgi:hypothetical protein